ncbi:hypothetical protein [Microbacterium sp. SS28]|uniref:hypothetical protein n=1 Tax=Microbacterium sp. SS28 TaxID=2919948 RepID=UPI001FAA619D|nr:hypothetical protein [Microbacterium sp. SS28]
MHEPSGDELRSLRARAYGRNADIHEDPAAVERLRDLEERAQADAKPVFTVAGAGAGIETDSELAFGPASLESPADEPDAEPERFERGAFEPIARDPARLGDTDPDDTASDAAAGADDPAGPDAEDDAEDETTTPRRRGALIWAGALTLALLAGAILTYTTMQFHPGSVGVLSADSEEPWPDSLGDRPDGGTVYQTFHGLKVVLVPQNWGYGDEKLPCLFVVPDSRNSTLLGAGCGAGDFDPTAAILITESLPAAVLDEFPVGSALQFVLHEGQVIVYADGP